MPGPPARPLERADARARAAVGRFLVPQGVDAGTQANRVRITEKVTTMHLEDGGGWRQTRSEIQAQNLHLSESDRCEFCV